MWSFNILLLLAAHVIVLTCHEAEEPTLYYYGLEESERSLEWCEPRQACAVVLQRYWRPRALVRLCRCVRHARRGRQHTRCDTLASDTTATLLELNNHAHLQFCDPVTDWPICSFDERPLTVVTSDNHMNPDELEEQHHKNIQLTPPKITLTCQCRKPSYWKLTASTGDTHIYQCASLPICSTDEFCGNVVFHLYALYQTCLCPKHHICVHNGGVPETNVHELLYNGKGWRAHCRRLENDYIYAEY